MYISPALPVFQNFFYSTITCIDYIKPPPKALKFFRSGPSELVQLVFDVTFRDLISQAIVFYMDLNLRMVHSSALLL